MHCKLSFFLSGVVGAVLLLSVANAQTLPEAGKWRVAYYAFDATPVGQGVLPLTTFTDNANIVVVFEGTLWELADTAHYNTGAMRNAVYTSKKQVSNDIQTLRKKGIVVLMNVDDAAAWSTPTPFTTWNGNKLSCKQFAAFVDSCVTAVGFDGISLDVEHKAVDNTDYRNLIRELGSYFGPLSSNPTSKVYTGAFYTSQSTAPGTIFREVALSRYLNFVMDMGYKHDNTERFNYWAATLGNAKVMNGMSHQYNSQSSAAGWAAWHPTPDKAGVMVFAANVNKSYTDTIFAALGSATRQLPPASARHCSNSMETSVVHGIVNVDLPAPSTISMKLFSITGRQISSVPKKKYAAGRHALPAFKPQLSPGMYILDVTADNCGRKVRVNWCGSAKN